MRERERKMERERERERGRGRERERERKSERKIGRESAEGRDRYQGTVSIGASSALSLSPFAIYARAFQFNPREGEGWEERGREG